MLQFRAFRNTDPPRMTEIWRSRAGDPALLQPVSVDLFEQLVFGKLHFDHAGLTLGFDDGRPVGFAHASFGPDADGRRISTETGVICVIVVRPDCDEAAVAAGLLDHCEAYLREHGARVLYGGGVPPLSPFYAGLYGGCELPGVLDSDKVSRALYPARGYAAVDRTFLLQRDLSTFRARVDRQEMQCRRRLLVQVLMDSPARNRWEALTAGDFDSTRFELVPRGGGRPVAYAVVRATEWGNVSRSGRIAGLVDLFVEPASRREGLATHLMGELARVLTSQGVAFVEAQSLERNDALVQFYRKLGFQQIAEGVVYRKEIRDA
jgi:ribosomal protein S18 acetylase RimI-like enzyme